MEVDIQRLRRWGSFCNLIGKRQLDACIVLDIRIAPSMFEPSKRNPLEMTVLQRRRFKGRIGIENIEQHLHAIEVGGKYGRRRKGLSLPWLIICSLSVF